MLARITLAALMLGALPARGQDALVTYKSLSPEIALELARAALDACRARGFQVTVAVVDRFGVTQVLLRDRFAGAHTVDVATNKAWSAVSFRTNTGDLERATRPDTTMAGLRHVPRATVVAGGVMIEAGGSLLGGIGVSGAPGGDADEKCARAGIKAIADDLEF